jgi:hypothetical protein
MRKIAHVGTLHTETDRTIDILVLDYLVRNHPNYLTDDAVHDDINLQWGRDFLLEDKTYDIVTIQFLYSECNEIPSNNQNPYLRGSPIHSPENWRKRLIATNADFIFAFGDFTEVNSLYFGTLEGYGLQSFGCSMNEVFTKDSIEGVPVLPKIRPDRWSFSQRNSEENKWKNISSSTPQKRKA